MATRKLNTCHNEDHNLRINKWDIKSLWSFYVNNHFFNRSGDQFLSPLPVRHTQYYGHTTSERPALVR